LHRERLYVQYESPEALRSEFEKNIANGGLFVATEQPYDVRQLVTVEVELTYLRGAGGADCPGGVVELDGEIVHCVPAEMASSGIVPGVALQLSDTVHALRARFESLLGKRAVEQAGEDREGPRNRGARRNAVRVPVRVMPSMSPPFEATSRDLSATGILLSLRDETLPMGELVRICLWHPSGDPSVVIDGKVVREVKNKGGRIAAAAVAFERNQAADTRVRSVLEALRQAGHRSQLGGISGSLADLGLANLLQMFGSSAPQGTLVVECDGDQGWIAFANGRLLRAELGALEGHDALVAMLDWGDGRFQFEASADPKLAEGAPGVPLAGALLEAVCVLDERDQAEATRAAPPSESEAESWDPERTLVFPSDEPSGGGYETAIVEIGPETCFEIDAEQEELSVGTLDKTEQAVIDLARSGHTRARIAEIIPEREAEIHKAVEALVELGVLRVR
jgi:Tfp pilus assembly protein PilZ